MKNDKAPKTKKKLEPAAVIAAVLAAALTVSVGMNIWQARIQSEAEQKLFVPASNAMTSELPVTAESKVTVSRLAEALESASELVTMKYYYTNADVYEKSAKVLKFDLPFADKTVFTYDGIIYGGIDVSEIAIDIDQDKMEVTLGLPKAKKIAHELDDSSFRFYDVKNSVFVSTSLEEYSDILETLKKQEEVKVFQSGFYKEVRKNAETVLRDLLAGSGLTDGYTLIFEDKV